MTENIHHDKVLLVGSGHTAPLAADWDLDGWFVCVMHNAWKAIPDKWQLLLHAEDFPDERKPDNWRNDSRLIDVSQYRRESFATEKHGGFWRNHFGFGKTMFFTCIVWILDNLDPKAIGCIGCDMHYPGTPDSDKYDKAVLYEADDNSFCGAATPDPLKYHRETLHTWLGFVDGFCCRAGITMINFSPYKSPTLLPFSHGLFPNDKPIERHREHRTDADFVLSTEG